MSAQAGVGGGGEVGLGPTVCIFFFFFNLLWIRAVGSATAAESGRPFEELRGCDPQALFLSVSQEVLSQSGGRGGEEGFGGWVGCFSSAVCQLLNETGKGGREEGEKKELLLPLWWRAEILSHSGGRRIKTHN